MITASENSRLRKILKNSAAGILTYVIQLIITFVSRMIFIKYLNIGYLGINSLYTNVLSLLSLADLGFDTVLMYSLYAPIANKQNDLIRKLVDGFKKIYKIIAIIIFVLGILLIPFLKYIIRDSGLSENDLIKYYLFFLVNTVSSYFVIYKSALLQADQKVYIIKLVKSGSQLLCGILQIISIVLIQNYTIYLCIMVFTTILNNIIVNFIANKKYPFIKERKTDFLDLNLKKELIENTKATCIYKIGTTIINSSTSILISIVLGSVFVGYYSNYYTVILAINSIIGIFITALIPSIGNYLTNKENKYNAMELFHIIIFLFFIIATIVTGILVLNFDAIIKIWIGKQFIISRYSVLVIIAYFFFQCIAHPVWIFRETSGLFRNIKNCIILMAILDISLAYLLGKIWGMSGIIFGTIIARLLTLFWYEPKLLYKFVFKEKVRNYWIHWIKYFILSCISLFIILQMIESSNKFSDIFCK